MKKSCGVYEIKNETGRISYKIFANSEDFYLFLQKNSGKTCERMAPVFTFGEYKEYEKTQVKKLTDDEITKYIAER